MHPITLRIPNDLLSEIESEADDLGYSSRAEYIRQLLQDRAHAREALSTDATEPVIDPEIVEANSEQIEAMATDLDAVLDRIERLEQELEASGGTTDTETTQDSSSTAASISVSSESEVKPIDKLETWLEVDGPQSDDAVTIIREAAKILNESGSMKASELRQQLHNKFPEAYTSANAMWASTVEHVYEDAPGFSKPEYGTYDFG